MTTTPSPQHQDNLKAIRIMLGCFLIVFLAWLLLGCATKNKVKSTERYTTEIAKVERVNELSENSTIKESLTVQVVEKHNVSIHENFRGEIADSSKQATITVENFGNKKVYTYTNFKNVNSENKTSEAKSKDSIGQNLSKQDKSKTTKETKVDEKGKASGRNSDVDVETKRTSTFVSIGIGLGILCCMILLFLFIYFRIKRGKEKP